MATTKTKLTAAEYYAQTVVGDRKQLVDGEIVVNEPKLIHAALQLRVAVAFQAWIDAGPGRGFVSLPTDLAIDEHNVFGPDLLWFAPGREPRELDAYPEHLPDLCVEIRSQSTWRYDIGAKKRACERAGLAELWLVDDASRSVIVYRRSHPERPSFDLALELGAGERLTSPLLPGFELDLERLFER